MEKNNDIIIKKADMTNYNDVLNIENKLEHKMFSKQSLLQDLENDIYSYFIAYTKDELIPIGFIGISDLCYTMDLLYIAVNKEKRNSSVGTKLLQYIEELAKNKGIEKIMLEVRDSNIIAIKFYEKRGFKKISVRKNYYQDTHEDAIIYEKIISKTEVN